ncbi:MAG: alpha/beta fold hydrolase, partial [Verrucomicrobiota bacterium]
KVRGIRLELGAVEAALRATAGVKQAAALVVGDAAHEKRLMAHVVGTVDPTHLKQQLHSCLPEHSIPDQIVVHDRFPINHNGKIDVSALYDYPLPSVDTEEVTSNSSSTPATALEQELSLIYSQVLSVNSPDTERSFFDLGGNSFLGLRLFTQIHQRLGYVLPLGHLYKCPSIRQLASSIEQHHENGGNVTTLSGEDARKMPIWLFHGGDGGILFYRPVVNAMSRARTLFLTESPFLSGDRIQPESLFQDLVDRYAALIMNHQPQGPLFLAGYSFGGLVALETARALQEKHDRIVLSVMLIDTPNSTDAQEFRLMTRARNYLQQRKEIRSPLRKLAALGKRFTTGMVSRWERRWLKGRAAHLLAQGKGSLTPSLRAAQVHLLHDNLVKDYRPTPYHGTVILLRAEDQGDRIHRSEQLGWEGILTNIQEVIPIPGHHETLFQTANANLLASTIEEAARGVEQENVSPSAPPNKAGASNVFPHHTVS